MVQYWVCIFQFYDCYKKEKLLVFELNHPWRRYIKVITSFVQYNRTSLPVLFWRVVFRNRTGRRCVTAQLTPYWLQLSSHCLWFSPRLISNKIGHAQCTLYTVHARLSNIIQIVLGYTYISYNIHTNTCHLMVLACSSILYPLSRSTCSLNRRKVCSCSRQ